MIGAMYNDFDSLAARVHGRRSRMADRERLEGLCRLRTLAEFTRRIFPGTELATATAFQRQAVHELMRELTRFRLTSAGAQARLLEWLLVRFQVENLKVLVRARQARIPFEDCQPHLAKLPKDLALDSEALTKAESLKEFAELLPRGVFRRCLARAALQDSPQPFFCEAALDQTYFQELIARTGELSGEDKDIITAFAQQEADTFHLMLVARGKFTHGLSREELLPLHVAGTGISRARFADMLADGDLRLAMARVAGRTLDEPPRDRGADAGATPQDAAAVEAWSWSRYARLASRVFRQGHVGFGAVIGYAGLRRAEIAKLITLSEGLRLGLAADDLRALLIPGAKREAAHV